MKLKVYIDVYPSQIGNNGEFRQDWIPSAYTAPPNFPMIDGKRFCVEVDLPCKPEFIDGTGKVLLIEEIKEAAKS